MSCDLTFLGTKPIDGSFTAVSNARLPVSIDLWTDEAAGVPLNLSGYVGRGAVKRMDGSGSLTPFSSVVITAGSAGHATNILGLISKATVEGLDTNVPYRIDIAVDNAATGDSFDILLGSIVFLPGVST